VPATLPLPDVAELAPAAPVPPLAEVLPVPALAAALPGRSGWLLQARRALALISDAANRRMSKVPRV
jgi:hypothetical protein